jgi:hypothetical protein
MAVESSQCSPTAVPHSSYLHHVKIDRKSVTSQSKGMNKAKARTRGLLRWSNRVGFVIGEHGFGAV